MPDETGEMQHDDLRRFARLLMFLVRDRSILACDQLAAGRVAGPDGERWRSLVTEGPVRRAFEELIPDVVDQVLFEFLNAIDNDELPLAWRRSDGSCEGLESLGLGEMAGWLMMSDGWRQRFSSQRFFDPLSGLQLWVDDACES